MEFTDLQNALKDAMKARDTDRKEAVQTLIAAVKKAAIDAGTRDNITSELVDGVILKELKVAKEQVDTCPAEYAEHLHGVSHYGRVAIVRLRTSQLDILGLI